MKTLNCFYSIVKQDMGWITWRRGEFSWPDRTTIYLFCQLHNCWYHRACNSHSHWLDDPQPRSSGCTRVVPLHFYCDPSSAFKIFPYGKGEKRGEKTVELPIFFRFGINMSLDILICSLHIT